MFRAADTTSLTEGLGMLRAGKIEASRYDELENTAVPTCGSCSFLGTANTMCCVAEAMGLTLPGSATIPATFADRLRVAQESGRRILDFFNKGITVRRSLQVNLPEQKIRDRQAEWRRPEPKFKKGYLALYSRPAESADKGAIIRHKIE